MSQRNLTILYASETGTAQEVSENIWRESKRYHCRGFVKPMDDYDVRNLVDEKLVLFVCSTTGSGGRIQVFCLPYKTVLAYRENANDVMLDNCLHFLFYRGA